MSEKINVENTTSSPVLVSIRNHTGVIELNRPRALNSLNPEMLDIIRQALSQWRHNDEVEQVLVYSNSPKAFCAGGDVRAARDGVLAEKWAEVDEFFEGEYALNGDIAEYPKPYIAVIDGVAMGGGLGISAHGSHRVVTEKAFASMPEMAIGYVTDVGIAYMSQRMVGTRGEADPALAKFWGLSGYRMYAADMLWSGLATHVVNDADAFIEDVIADGVDAAIEKHAVEPEGQPELAGLIQDIDEVFQHATWEEIAAALPQHPELAELFAKLTEKACASALVAATELFEAEANAAGIREALRMELELGKHMLRRPDFAEGVRAVLVDKTQDAQFQPVGQPEEFRAAIARA
ncbi:TPA: enoyl-CoA hydratase/isomerase family protein [Corynebacterium striatum]|nr:enoyl-CoA hydratase/isomerase family protein [Corynebacterium striatum]